MFVLKEEGLVQKRVVQYGYSDGLNIPISEGLSEGEVVLISGHTRLDDGAVVLVVKN